MDIRLLALLVPAVSLCQATLAAPPKKKLLLVSHTAGFRHEEGIAAGERTLAEIGERSGAFSVAYCRTADDVKKMLTPEYLNAEKFDGVVFLNTTGDIGVPDLKAFIRWIETGKAFIGMHAATDTYHGNDDYLNLIGDAFVTHGRQCTIEPLVQDPKHPATVDWPRGTKIHEEVYIFKRNDRSKVHVLLYLDKTPDDGRPEANQPGDCLLAWNKVQGKGRVFYTAFGHRGDVWDNEVIRVHMLGGIRWALGLAKGDAKPGPAKP
ncbi:MAG: ThuA domain-containing protein [Chthonomonadales bacterium]|nr:ThuA domain-containing protein [Chthonomonadales bacterium]